MCEGHDEEAVSPSGLALDPHGLSPGASCRRTHICCDEDPAVLLGDQTHLPGRLLIHVLDLPFSRVGAAVEREALKKTAVDHVFRAGEACDGVCGVELACYIARWASTAFESWATFIPDADLRVPGEADTAPTSFGGDELRQGVAQNIHAVLQSDGATVDAGHGEALARVGGPMDRPNARRREHRSVVLAARPHLNLLSCCVNGDAQRGVGCPSDRSRCGLLYNDLHNRGGQQLQRAP
mmetsp:Transcript_89240/g.257337  ORF Transcript_89240/g.257337 Transcript_89240/m.257337 type:complete len:238 (+) Transcript_89240:1880-2593(+)